MSDVPFSGDSLYIRLTCPEDFQGSEWYFKFWDTQIKNRNKALDAGGWECGLSQIYVEGYVPSLLPTQQIFYWLENPPTATEPEGETESGASGTEVEGTEEPSTWEDWEMQQVDLPDISYDSPRDLANKLMFHLPIEIVSGEGFNIEFIADGTMKFHTNAKTRILIPFPYTDVFGFRGETAGHDFRPSSTITVKPHENQPNLVSLDVDFCAKTMGCGESHRSLGVFDMKGPNVNIRPERIDFFDIVQPSLDSFVVSFNRPSTNKPIPRHFNSEKPKFNLTLKARRRLPTFY